VPALSAILASTWLVDGVIALTVLETAVLAWRGRRRGVGHPLRGIVLNALAGLGLLLALRAALTPAPGLIAPALALAGLAHVGDLWARTRPAAHDA